MAYALLLLFAASAVFALPMCVEHHGFAGEQSTFELELPPGVATSGLAQGQALVLFAKGIGPNAVQVSTGGKQSLPDQALVLTQLPPAPITVTVSRATSWDTTPFSFISYIANSDVCRINIGTATLAIPLPAIETHPANVFLEIVPQTPNLYFTISISAPAAVTASFSNDRTTAPDAGTHIGMNAPVPGAFATVSSPAYITARGADGAVDLARFVVTQSQTAPTGYVDPASKPPTWKEAAKEKAVATEGFLGWFLTRVLLLFFIYLVVRSVINYRNGITTFPEFVPHHAEFGHAVTQVGVVIDKVRGGGAPASPVAGAGIHTTARRGYESVSGFQP